jgi:glucoamylase
MPACVGSFVLALGFGRRAEEAALRVRASLGNDIDRAIAEYGAGWRAWQDSLLALDAEPRPDG